MKNMLARSPWSPKRRGQRGREKWIGERRCVGGRWQTKILFGPH